MIVCKKPCTLYDVDLIGLVGLAALGLAAWWLVLAPWQTTWNRYRELAVKHLAAESKLQQEVLELKQFQERLAQIEGTVTSQAEEVPHAAWLSRLLRKMTDLAKEAELEVHSVAPQPAIREGEYLVNDIQLTGRGRSHGLIRFLDQLARENPYQSLRYCSITHSAGESDPTCELSLTVRLYLLPLDRPGPVKGQDRTGGQP